MLGRTSHPQRRDDGPAAAGRLDPVRWRPPGRGTLIRLATVAALLGTAAVTVWTGPPGCPPDRTPACPPAPADPAQGPAQGPAQATTPAPDTATSTAPAPDTATGTAPARMTGPGGDAVAGDDDAGPARRALPSGTVGVPVQLAGRIAVRLLRPGDRVDLFAVDSPGAAPAPVAQDALVLAVTGTDDADGGLLVALRPAGAQRARNTPHRSGFEVLLRSG